MGNGNFKRKKSEGSRSEQDSILTCGDRLCTLNTITRLCYERQLDVAYTLKELADELEKQEDDVSKAKVGIAVVGGALAAVSFGLSFLTLGSSLVLTVVGAGIATASGAGAIAASVAERILQNKKIKAANAAILSYTQAVTEFAPVLEHFCDSLSTPEEQERLREVLTDDSIPSDRVHFSGIQSDGKLCETCSKGQKIVLTALRVKEALGINGFDDGGRSESGTAPGTSDIARWGLDMITGASTFGKESFRSLSAASKAIQIGGSALSGVGLIIDVGTIIYYSIKVHKKQPSEVAQLLRKIANAFEQ